MYLYHYYDKSIGPFKNISELSKDDAIATLADIRKKKPGSMCAQRQADYMDMRSYYEGILRDEFIKKGGRIERIVPHYMVVESCEWLSSWYEDSAFIKIPINEFDIKTVSFTYGDSHPTFSDRVNDGKEYRKQLYTYDEILKVIDKYGLPQEWNKYGKYGPERYIEAHIWSDSTINKYLRR